MDDARGSVENPLSWPDHVAKFKDCVEWAAARFPAAAADEALAMLKDLEKVKDVTRIIQIFG